MTYLVLVKRLLISFYKHIYAGYSQIDIDVHICQRVYTYIRYVYSPPGYQKPRNYYKINQGCMWLDSSPCTTLYAWLYLILAYIFDQLLSITHAYIASQLAVNKQAIETKTKSYEEVNIDKQSQCNFFLVECQRIFGDYIFQASSIFFKLIHTYRDKYHLTNLFLVFADFYFTLCHD